jgi:hypothetical protein
LGISGADIHKDNALQVLFQLIFAHAGQLRHIRKIDIGFFAEGHGQRFACCINAGNDRLLFYRPFGENVRLAFQFAVLVDVFKGAEKIVRAVGIERPVVGR